MPTSTRETILARYHYDPLDRQVDCTPFDQAAIQRYYCKTRLSTEVQGSKQHTILQHDDQLLAQQQQQQQQREDGKVTATLLVTDQQRSVLNTLNATQPNHLAYSPYGHRPLENGLLSLLGFNGERPDTVTGHYFLGNYRHFNPVLMRFNSPDSWSPFGKGELNAYAYCSGDPRNRIDPTGHNWFSEAARSLWRNLFKSSKRHNIYKNDATRSKVVSAQKGLELEKAKNELATTTLELAERRDLQKLDNLKYEGIISSQKDEIEKLKIINQKLQSKLNRRPVAARSQLGPPIPKRPVETLASHRTNNDLWHKQLEYLDLAVDGSAIRNGQRKK